MSDPLWRAAEACEATGGQLIGGSDWQASGVSIDSRSLEKGDIFVALKDQRDGHDFARAAMAAGAAVALVSDPSACDGPRLVVDDVLEALQCLGAAARTRCDAIRVGVTGSVGKTSVKDALAAVFHKAGKSHNSVKSYNNHWGVPLTLARMPRETQRAVFEMGMNHAGEIRGLSAQVNPHIAVITRIAPAHLENLGTIENIAKAKSEIFEGLLKDGVAVLPRDDDQAAILTDYATRSGAAFLLDFGVKAGAAVRIVNYNDGPDGGVGTLDVMGRHIGIRLAMPGMHQAWNAAAVMAAGVAAGCEPEMIADVLSGLRAGAGRGDVFDLDWQGGQVTIIDDSYNANPVSMASAIGNLGARTPREGGRRIAILGEMLELGPDAVSLHEGLAERLECAEVDIVIGVGDLMRALVAALPEAKEERDLSVPTGGYIARSPGEALSKLRELLKDGDVVLIKGSNASGVHKIVAGLKQGEPVRATEA
ncbi:UDP-N-acetylmuramoyl-tripeptide--D-alanyl-D-alanine ligase [Woodsholea maritima]|uniref:UDP-N-acetylmuramoyl-tripeptide--D-alanyl-D- alanine ligase n=1 Tax=Woodsholea maritima TaxID=240237 RepID=UPI0003817E96|nr:UDP-N-acetylmuramoyl-tripeptide--D-alanyl-D-alanine ligase [Woodsholea maritima]